VTDKEKVISAGLPSANQRLSMLACTPDASYGNCAVKASHGHNHIVIEVAKV
jgi:hypothetical protein